MKKHSIPGEPIFFKRPISKSLAPLSLLALLAVGTVLFSACSSSGESSVASSSMAASSAADAKSADYAPAAAPDLSIGELLSGGDGYAEEISQDAESSILPQETGGYSGGETSQIAMVPEQAPEETARKIVYRSFLQLETEAFEKDLERIKAAVEESGGYMESVDTQGRSIQYANDAGDRTASITARIPANKLKPLTASIGGICNIRSNSESAEDISDTYYDAAAHLRSMSLQEERLLAILEKAESLEDVISLEQALSETRYEIEALTASLKRMDSQVSYSYLQMDLYEVRAYTPSSGQPYTFGEKLANSFRQAGDNLSNSLQGLLFFLIADGPVLIINLLVVGFFFYIVVLFVKFLLRRAGIENRFTVKRTKRTKNAKNSLAQPLPAVSQTASQEPSEENKPE